MILSAMTGKFPDYAKVVQYFLIFARFKTDIINKSRLDIMKKTVFKKRTPAFDIAEKIERTSNVKTIFPKDSSKKYINAR